MLQICRERGITWRLGRLWDGGTRQMERRFKNTTHSSKRCAICNPDLQLTVFVPLAESSYTSIIDGTETLPF